MIITVLLWGAVAGLVHFVVIGILYGNPLTDRISAGAEAESPAVRKWPSKVKYFVTQFFGTQVEVYILTFAFVWLRPLVGLNGYGGGLLLETLISPRSGSILKFWNMWIQTTYPFRLLLVEVVNGTIGTLVICVFLQLVTQH